MSPAKIVAIALMVVGGAIMAYHLLWAATNTPGPYGYDLPSVAAAVVACGTGAILGLPLLVVGAGLYWWLGRKRQ